MVLTFTNTIGQAYPSYVLFKGKRTNIDWIEFLPPEADINMTEKGSMTTESFIIWVEHFRNKRLLTQHY